jgi:hypothetical protein
MVLLMQCSIVIPCKTTLGLALGEIALDDQVNHTVDYIYTIYNGKCKRYRILQTMTPKNYLTFHARKNETLLMFLLHPGEEIFLLWQQWLNVLAPVVEISSDVLVETER